jgi:hypothetical protein
MNPTFFEQHAESRSAFELVLGAMLGGYLGLTISKNGLTGGDYLDLGKLLALCCFFVLSINSSTDRFHRQNWIWAGGYAVVAVIFATLAARAASPLSVDPQILVTVFVVWGFFAAFEIMTAAYAFYMGKTDK